jgi:1-acyl-sn-glycerol-3-phosphate acyltransferase
VYIAVSLIADTLITVCGHLVSSAADIWKPLLIFVGLFLACLIINVLLLLIVSRFAKEIGRIHEPTRWLTLEMIDVLMRIIGVRIHVTGLEKIPTDERFMLVSNHLKIFDPMVGLLVFRKYRLVFISKKENMDMPIGNKVIIGVGSLPIDRDNDRAALKTILQAIKLIKTGEESIGVYPEGGTNKTEEPLLPFRNGSFKIAQKSGAPIVVTTIVGTEKILKQMLRKRTHVYVDVLRVIPHADIVDLHTDEVGERGRDIMLKNLEKRRDQTRR